MRNMARKFAFRAALTLFAVIMLWSMFVAHANPDSWLTGPASPALIRWAAIIVAVYYGAFGLFLFVAHQQEKMRLAEQAAANHETAQAEQDRVVTSMANRRGPAPTQPIPVPPGQAAGDD